MAHLLSGQEDFAFSTQLASCIQQHPMQGKGEQSCQLWQGPILRHASCRNDDKVKEYPKNLHNCAFIHAVGTSPHAFTNFWCLQGPFNSSNSRHWSSHRGDQTAVAQAVAVASTAGGSTAGAETEAAAAFVATTVDWLAFWPDNLLAQQQRPAFFAFFLSFFRFFCPFSGFGASSLPATTAVTSTKSAAASSRV